MRSCLRIALSVAGCLWLAGTAQAAEITVMISGGLTAAFKTLVPTYERSSGNTVKIAYGPSMGTTVNAIPVRLARGEPADVLIMVGSALGDLVQQGQVTAASRVDLANSPIGMVVKTGAPKPDISTVAALRQTLLAAKSIGYSDSASGVYIGTELFVRLGIADQMKDKARGIPAEPVAAVVARGDIELGFQQVSELLPVKGVDLVGELPAEVQKITVFSAGIPTQAQHPTEGRALIAFLQSPDARSVITKSGLQPIAPAP